MKKQELERQAAQHYAQQIYDGPVGGFPVGTPATREVLEALPSGSLVATYGNPWAKGDDGRWGSLLAPGHGADWRSLDDFARVAAFVVYDSTDAYACKGRFDSEVFKRYDAACGRTQ